MQVNFMEKIKAISNQQSAVGSQQSATSFLLWQLYEPGNVLIFQVRREGFLEVETCVAEMGFDRAFGLLQAGGNLFYGQVLSVVKEKYLFASLCETLDRCAEVCPEFLGFDVSAGIGMRLSDMAFICGVQGFDVVCFLLFSEVVDTDVFSDTVQP